MKEPSGSNRILVLLAYLGFVSIGLPDGLIGVAWPSIRATFHLPVDALGPLLVTFTAGYMISTFRNGWLRARMHTGLLLAFSCLAAGACLCGFALAGRWSVMLALAMLGGFGAGAIDAGLNTYAAENFSRRTVNWLHAFYGVGAAVGPLLMTAVLMADRSWRLGYAIVGAGQLALALCFLVTGGSWKRNALQSETRALKETPALSTMRLPMAQLSILSFFIYTGIEAAAGTWAYSLFTEARRVKTDTAGAWVSLYWAALTLGRIIAGLTANRIPPLTMVRTCILGMAAGIALLWLNFTDGLSFGGLVLAGLFAAPIFPTLISMTPGRLGSTHTPNSIGFQLAGAVLGQSLLPSMIGLFAAMRSLEVVGPALFISTVILLVVHEAMCFLNSRTSLERTSIPV